MSHYPLKIENTSTLPRYFWHPSVVYIQEGFGGHKWWMAQTPFPPCNYNPYRDRCELPCIHYSDNGVRWYAIPANPIDDITKEQEKNKDFMSDTHLVYRDGCLELYYRISIRVGQHETKTQILKKQSKDGVHWSEREIIVDLWKEDEVQKWGEQVISQSLIWTGKEYLCWYVDGSWFRENRKVRLNTSKDGKEWGEPKVCTLSQYIEAPWHIDVQYIKGAYHMLCYYYKSDVLHHLISKDGLNWEFDTQVLTHSKSLLSFYSYKIYRSCLVAIDNVFYIYFSAATSFRSYIGLLSTTDWKTFKPVGPRINIEYILDTPITIIRKIFKKIGKLLKHKK